MLEVDSALERQGCRGCTGSLIIEVERLVQEFKCWEIRTLQMCVCMRESQYARRIEREKERLPAFEAYFIAYNHLVNN